MAATGLGMLAFRLADMIPRGLPGLAWPGLLLDGEAAGCRRGGAGRAGPGLWLGSLSCQVSRNPRCVVSLDGHQVRQAGGLARAGLARRGAREAREARVTTVTGSARWQAKPWGS